MIKVTGRRAGAEARARVMRANVRDMVSTQIRNAAAGRYSLSALRSQSEGFSLYKIKAEFFRRNNHSARVIEVNRHDR